MSWLTPSNEGEKTLLLASRLHGLTLDRVILEPH